MTVIGRGSGNSEEVGTDPPIMTLLSEDTTGGHGRRWGLLMQVRTVFNVLKITATY